MSYCDDDNFFGNVSFDDIVRKTFEEEFFGSCGTQHVRRDEFVFEQVHNPIDRPVEFDARPGMLLLVPSRHFNFCLSAPNKLIQHKAHGRTAIRRADVPGHDKRRAKAPFRSLSKSVFLVSRLCYTAGNKIYPRLSSPAAKA